MLKLNYFPHFPPSNLPIPAPCNASSSSPFLRMFSRFFPDALFWHMPHICPQNSVPWGCRQGGSCMACMIPLLTHFLPRPPKQTSLKCFRGQSWLSVASPAPADSTTGKYRARFCKGCSIPFSLAINICPVCSNQVVRAECRRRAQVL